MLFDDASAAFHGALRNLLDSRATLGLEGFEILDAEIFTAAAETPELALSLAERREILRQASFLIEDLYCHLPFKRARYAIDPEQQIRLLERQLHELSATDFHRRLLNIFASLRDVHTNYFLPEPYASAIAFLPFTVRYFHDETQRRRYEVAAVMNGFNHPHFLAGAEITRWNGLTIDLAIERASDMASGANPSARFLRGLQSLTVRPLRAGLPPSELYVLIEYRAPQDAAGAEPRAILFPWKILTGGRQADSQSSRYGSLAPVPVFTKQAIRRIFFYTQTDKYACFEPDSLGPPPSYGAPIAPPPELIPQIPNQIDFQLSSGVDRPWAVPTGHLRLAELPDRNFAYIRIADFGLSNDRGSRDAAFRAFVEEFRRILSLANERAPDGLIVDIRGNPGGDIVLAEELLQALTPNEIRPARFALRQTTFVQNMAAGSASGEIVLKLDSEWGLWANDLNQAPFTGNLLTRAFPLSDEKKMNLAGQVYQGPVVLITDGLTYSAADFFAAAFQDNNVGTVLGVQASTGGGGANRWSHEDLMANIGMLESANLRPLPKSASMGVSVRRSLRAGKNNGQPLEDIGVVSDKVHLLTKADVDNYNWDLLQAACRLLAEKPSFHLSIRNLQRRPDPSRVLDFEIATRGLVRVEASLTSITLELPQKAFSIPGDGVFQLSMEMEALPPRVTHLNLRGYSSARRGRSLELTAETRVPLKNPGPEPPAGQAFA
jgi:C-terminal processing protease CtpA/Prc